MRSTNAIFRRDDEVSIDVTYMTGTLVKIGDKLADAALGGSRTAWIPYLLLWFALVFGGILGTVGYVWSPNATIWSAAAFAILLAAVSQRLTRPLATSNDRNWPEAV